MIKLFEMDSFVLILVRLVFCHINEIIHNLQKTNKNK